MSFVIPTQRSVRGAGFVAILLLAVPAAAFAEPVEVAFDLAPTVACQDVTPAEFAALHPEEKVVALALRVSVRVTAGSAAQLEELEFELTSPERRLRVLDFDPETQLESDTAGLIEISTTHEKARSLGTNIAGDVALPSWPGDAHIAPAANAGTTERDVVTETRKKIPTKTVALTSGTTNHGHGVFFKIRRSLSGSFEGVHEFGCRVVVPRDWQGDWVLVRCQARGERKKYFVKSIEPCGQTTALVGLYLEGALSAKQAAFHLARAHELAVAASARTPASSDPLATLAYLVSDTTAKLSGQSANSLDTERDALRTARARLARYATGP